MNDERGLLPESHALWARTTQGKVVGVDIDGRNIFQWRREYIELSREFAKYAWHTNECDRYSDRNIEAHRHTTYIAEHGIEPRAVCDAVTCTCGVLVILSVMLHPTKFVYACPNQPTPIHLDADRGIPQTLWGIPIVESDALPQGTIEVGYGERMRVRLTNIGDNRYIVEELESTVPNQEVLGIDTDDPDKV